MPKACLKQTHGAETKGKKTTQQYLETENKLCSGSEKPQGKKKRKNLASISEFPSGKLQEYLVS